MTGARMWATGIAAWLLSVAVVTGCARPLGAWNETLAAATVLAVFAASATFVWLPFGAKQDRIGLGLTRACLHILLTLILVSAWGGGPRGFQWVWCVSLGLVVVGRTWSAKTARPSMGLGGFPAPATILVSVIALGLAAWMLATPSGLNTNTDMPAHVGAIRDAVESQRIWPPDESFPGAHGIPDPRFGILHGFYAMVAGWSGADPLSLVAVVPFLLTPLWWFAHAWWFRLWRVPPNPAYLLALLFTVAGAGGRGFGLWSSAYPGNAAIAMAALGMAALWGGLASRDEDRWRPDASWWFGALLIAASARVHPFAWWGTTCVLLQAVPLLALVKPTRRWWFRIAVTGLFLLGAGAVLLAPVLARRGASESGLHQMPVEVVFLGAERFVADPLVLAHWGGLSALFVAPLLLIVPRAWWTRPERVIAASAALLVWTVSLNPVVAPWAWDLVSYLLLRTTRLVHTTWWWWSLAALGWTLWRARGMRGSRTVVAALLILLGGAALATELKIAFDIAAGRVERREITVSRARLAVIDAALREANVASFAADPRLSYALRALGSPLPVVYPLAHASPLDVDLPRRLELYRSLYGPMTDPNHFARTLRDLGATHLLVDLRPEAMAVASEFGYEAQDSRSRGLAERMRSWVAPVAEGVDWLLFEVPARGEPPGAPPRSDEPSMPTGGSGGDLIAHGSRFGVAEGRVLENRVPRGGVTEVRLRYLPTSGPVRTAHPDWERVYLRFTRLGEPQVPGWATSFDKVYRKVVRERSPRSRARFGEGWVPFGGTWDAGDWARLDAWETRELRIPRFVRPGRYAVEVSVQEATWRTRLDWRDFARDEDRMSGTVLDTLVVLDESTSTGFGPKGTER